MEPLDQSIKREVLKACLDGFGQGAVVIDGNGSIIFINQKIRQILSPEFWESIVPNDLMNGLHAHQYENIDSHLRNYSLSEHSFYTSVHETTVAGRKYFVLEIYDERNENDILRKLASHLLALIENERKYIAREIHDGFSSYLLSLKLKLGYMLGTLSETSKQQHANLMHETLQEIDLAIATIRDVIGKIRPPLIQEFGLVASIEYLIETLQKQSGIKFELSVLGTDEDLSEDVAIHLYRISQECLYNVVKHSMAKLVKIQIEISEMMTLIFQDDGVGGVVLGDKPLSFGLIGVRERVAMLNGTFSLNSPINKGTSLCFNIPKIRKS